MRNPLRKMVTDGPCGRMEHNVPKGEWFMLNGALLIAAEDMKAGQEYRVDLLSRVRPRRHNQRVWVWQS